MSEPPGRTLLSQWINPSTQSSTEDAIKEASSEPTSHSKPVEKEKAVKMWGDIFKKPPKAPETNTIESIMPSLPSIQRRNEKLKTRRLVNPHNPFNSYVVSMKFPKHLNDELENRKAESSFKSVENSLEPARTSTASKPADAKFAQPEFIHVFHVPQDQLKQLKPKGHPFFAKRNTTGALKANSSPTSAKLQPAMVQKEAPWDTLHLRPTQSWHHPKLPRRKRHYTEISNHIAVNEEELPPVYIPPMVHLPTRLLASSSQVNAMAQHSQSPSFSDANTSLLEYAGHKKPYDKGQFESKMWCEIYAPQHWQGHLTPSGAEKVCQWLTSQLHSRSKYLDRKHTRGTKRRSTGYAADDGFVVDDNDCDEGIPGNDILLVCGANGSGKTSAVYAAAHSLDAFVFEVSTAVKRTGKSLTTMLDGISQNHAVHSAKNVIILIDDGDVIFESEAGGFWPAISRFAATSRRPVVMTCTEPRQMALSGVAIETVYFPRPDLVRVTDLAWLIALSEGHIVDRLRLARLVVAWKGDIRRVLAQLQFWCQMGIGGSPSSEEWVPKEYEMVENDADRVISNGTWFPDAPPIISDLKPQNVFDDAFTDDPIELASVADTVPLLSTHCHRPATENCVWNNGALSLTEWSEPIDIPYRGNEPALHDVFQMESSYGTSTRHLACDVSPYMRLMVAADYNRMLAMQNVLARQTEREARMTRRLWQANGIDSRQYLELSKRSMDIVLRTGYPVHYFT